MSQKNTPALHHPPRRYRA